MKNNKGYYSWIHSMKNAAMQSHFNGQKMLNETAGEDDERFDPKVARKIALSRKIRSSGEKAKLQSELQRSAAEEERMRQEIMNPSTENEGDMDIDARAAHRYAMGQKDLEVADVTNDGVKDAQDVVADVQDGKVDHQDSRFTAHLPKAQRVAVRQPTKFGKNIPLSQRFRDIATALDMRERGQHGELSQYHKELLGIHDAAIRSFAENQAAETAEEYADEMLGAGHGPLGVRFESVNQKISRLLNG